ncbi:C45 family peptidase [Brevibacterium sp.]|uniref:C45 family peptidase n=1 Tax=Brevibacterium sp. TaxID=1701 RepID=UPI002812591A|nr:C45 family peptidase [Brevibacterium sp.]
MNDKADHVMNHIELDTLSASEPPRLVRAMGDPFQIGNEIGSQTANLIAESLNTYMNRFQRDAGHTPARVRELGQQYGSALREWDPRIARTLEGMANTSDQEFELLVALNARTELLYGAPSHENGCTSVAVLPQGTASGHTLLAQNWDWRMEQQRNAFVLATRDENGFASIVLTEAGMLMKSGFNSSGIGLCNNLLVSDRDGSLEGTVPMHLAIRGVVDQPRMSLAHRKLLPTARSSSANVLLADGGGEAIDFELVPDDFGVIYPKNHLIVHANHFETEVPVRDLKRSTFALTLLRSPRLRRLLEAKAIDASVTTHDIATALRDGYSSPDALCRYPDPDLPEYEQLATIFSVIMDLDAREFWIAGFPVDRSPYFEWNLDTVFDHPEPRVGLFPAGTEERS